MKKMMLTAGLVVVAGLFVVGAAFAWCGSGMGYGPGYYGRGANTQTVRNLQRETLSMRDALMAKEIDLENEYMKPAPDVARIASIKKEIIDIQAKIQVVADKYGAPAWGPGYGGRMGGGMMAGAGCPCW
ncbi:MAG: hypothetical protein WC405_03985 [Syntrophales bacterium]